jgi:hypothetical protein
MSRSAFRRSARRLYVSRQVRAFVARVQIACGATYISCGRPQPVLHALKLVHYAVT